MKQNLFDLRNELKNKLTVLNGKIVKAMEAGEDTHDLLKEKYITMDNLTSVDNVIFDVVDFFNKYGE